jgi:signal transduction histidine kinase
MYAGPDGSDLPKVLLPPKSEQMQDLSNGAAVSDRTGPPPENPLIRLDRWLGSLGMATAVSVLTTGAAVLAVLAASLFWLVAFGTLPFMIPVLAGVVSAVVAWPIILHSQKLIKALDRKKRDLTSLTTALAQSRDAAEASNRAKITFLANMSHELRTPLNAIIGFSEMIKDEKNGPVTPHLYADYAADIHDSGRRLLDIINSVLDLSRLESGELEPELEAIDLERLIADCLRELKADVDKAALVIENHARTRVDAVLDPRLAKRILFNTLSNAIKFNRAGGTVRIELTAAGREATVAIIDSGIGMSEAEVATALQPFHQIDTSLDRRYDGTGLGLPLAKALIEQQGGRLRIESEPDVGTAVTLSFPLAP